MKKIFGFLVLVTFTSTSFAIEAADVKKCAEQQQFAEIVSSIRNQGAQVEQLSHDLLKNVVVSQMAYSKTKALKRILAAATCEDFLVALKTETESLLKALNKIKEYTE